MPKTTPDTEVLIRPADDADVEQLSSINQEVQALHAAAMPDLFKPSAGGFPPGVLSNPDAFVFVADNGGVVVGYAYAETRRQPETPWRYAQELAYVHQIGVSAPFRGQGIGAKLIEAVAEAARKSGIRLVALDVWSLNQRPPFLPAPRLLHIPRAAMDGIGVANHVADLAFVPRENIKHWPRRWKIALIEGMTDVARSRGNHALTTSRTQSIERAFVELPHRLPGQARQ